MNDPNPVARLFGPAARLGAILCGWWLLAISALTCVEIVGRKLFGFSLQGVDEIGAYTTAVIGAISFAQALITRGHTRIDFLIVRLPVTLKATLNTLAMVTLAGLAGFALYRGAFVVKESVEFMSRSTSPLQTPLWIPQSLWLAGLALFAAVAAGLAGHAVALLFRDPERVNRLYGPPSLDEEIAREVSALQERRVDAA